MRQTFYILSLVVCWAVISAIPIYFMLNKEIWSGLMFWSIGLAVPAFAAMLIYGAYDGDRRLKQKLAL